MYARSAEPALRRLLGWYPVVVIAGPRQSGKTTLVRACLPEMPYASLEDPDLRGFAAADPRGFLARYPDGAVLDEVQRAPELFSSVQTRVDETGRSGQFVLTGSQQFGLHSGVAQSLAGRAGALTLLPFTIAEVAPHRPALAVEDYLLHGLYPPVHDRRIPPHVWFSDYVATYVERDVRQLTNVRDLAAFHRFVQLCAARSGQLLNLSALAADAGITHPTAQAWIGVLEASHLVMRLMPHHSNLGKRLTKAPKLYFLDVGLAAWLAGVRDVTPLRWGALRGPLFETLVVGELVKHIRNGLMPHSLSFWRTHGGHEVDVLVSGPEGLLAVEVKSGLTVAADAIRPLDALSTLVPGLRRAVVYAGDTGDRRGDVEIVPWWAVGTLLEPTRA